MGLGEQGFGGAQIRFDEPLALPGERPVPSTVAPQDGLGHVVQFLASDKRFVKRNIICHGKT